MSLISFIFVSVRFAWSSYCCHTSSVASDLLCVSLMLPSSELLSTHVTKGHRVLTSEREASKNKNAKYISIWCCHLLAIWHLKALILPAYVARVTFLVDHCRHHFHGPWNWWPQRPTKRWRQQSILVELEPLIVLLKNKSADAVIDDKIQYYTGCPKNIFPFLVNDSKIMIIWAGSWVDKPVLEILKWF